MNKKICGIIPIMILFGIFIANILFLENIKTVRDNILSKNFITVQPNYRYAINKASFDLKNHSFANLSYEKAIKEGKFYYGNRHVRHNGEKEFELRKQNILAYPLIATKITQKDIKANNFIMEQQVPKNYQSKLKELNPNYNNTKVKVTYNHQFLPVKVELYSNVSRKWKIYRKYYYPSKDTYEKELNECIEAVLNGDFGED